MAERLGRSFPQPQKPPTAGAVGTHGVRRMAFEPETSLEAIFAGLVGRAEEILIGIARAIRSNTRIFTKRTITRAAVHHAPPSITGKREWRR